MFVLSMCIGFVVHATLLAADYTALGPIMRPMADQQNYFVYMLLAHVFLAVGFVKIYLVGKDDSKPFMVQGIRYGLLVSILVAAPMYLIYYAVQPLPGMLVLKQIIFDSIGYVIMGVAVAALNK
jgi:hypothetical protein